MEINIVDKENNLIAHIKIDFEKQTVDDIILYKDYEIVKDGAVVNLIGS